MNGTNGHEESRELIRDIGANEEGAYLEVPFEVPAETERVHISYQYEGTGGGKATIDLGLRDAERIRGWSGGARSECFVEEEAATPGYRKGRPMAGTWAILLGAYRVPPQGCRVRIRITLTRAHLRWLKGDLHSHTVHSDGSYTLDEAARIMMELGCDFLATTDHNTTSQNDAHPWGKPLVFIPGMELTHHMGHANLLGSREPVKDFRTSDRLQLDARLEEAKSNGALRVINHPFCPFCPWLWGMDAASEAVEIWNGPWRELNRIALDWWQEQLASGKRITAVGGSDVHRPDEFVKHAHPTSYIYSGSKTAEGLLTGLSKGRVYMTFAPYGPILDMRCGAFGIGDRVSAPHSGEPVSIRLDRLHKGDKIRLLNEHGVIREWEMDSDNGNWETSHSGAEYLFLRVEVWRYFQEAKDDCPALIANPIYFQNGNSACGTVKA